LLQGAIFTNIPSKDFYWNSDTLVKSEAVLVDPDISELALAKMVKTAVQVFLSFADVLEHEVQTLTSQAYAIPFEKPMLPSTAVFKAEFSMPLQILGTLDTEPSRK